MSETVNRKTHIRLTSHPGSGKKVRFPLHWGADTPEERGPIVGTVTEAADRNAIGTHGGSYSLYRALAVTSGALNPIKRPDLTNTSPTHDIGPFPSWKDPQKIVSLDPWGHVSTQAFAGLIAEGIDIRPTIAVTQAHLVLNELKDAVREGRLEADGKIVKQSGDVAVTKAALEPVWYLPGLAERFGVEETRLRRVLFEQTGGMFPELVTRPDLLAFLPPIGSITVYIFGDPAALAKPEIRLTCRVHDECNGSDVFGSDICTCRPYLIHGIEECIKEAQNGGVGLIVYNRKEGRALGEVTKFLVYNARKRQEGGDTASEYFERTECVAGVQDARFQELMPDTLHWLGITKIDRFVSMSNMKYDAVTRSGIEIRERISIPDDLIPADAQVEMEAKKAAGYYSEEGAADDLSAVKGRNLND
ncbi:GTP cyclohydrolase II [Acuticoccus sp. MNP-M23]|uniref:GTP cyclohydrolase II n=1 Tax=Acuticoccus sp. MNP-M23 TaxID=3072793 RepID=UPI002814C888|nr:GTP cyclohydrolase II [Acuticoccus sp. MNP-M23]WMS43052.1 GTP cyclohydrolase II [Acuticoccus sp. MNP-M23]